MLGFSQYLQHNAAVGIHPFGQAIKLFIFGKANYSLLLRRLLWTEAVMVIAQPYPANGLSPGHKINP
jgi:hypothetical protein